MQFDAATQGRIDAAYEVDIETTRPDGSRQRTTIWAVIDDGAVYVRSWRGERGHWYQAALARPDEARLIVDAGAIPVRAVWTNDEASVTGCSRGLSKKYQGDPALPSMLRAGVAATTLRLEPR